MDDQKLKDIAIHCIQRTPTSLQPGKRITEHTYDFNEVCSIISTVIKDLDTLKWLKKIYQR